MIYIAAINVVINPSTYVHNSYTCFNCLYTTTELITTQHTFQVTDYFQVLLEYPVEYGVWRLQVIRADS